MSRGPITTALTHGDTYKKGKEMNNLTQEQLFKLFNYDPDTGIFRYRVACGKIYRGDIAGSASGLPSKKYITIMIDYKNYYAHRLAFLWMTGEWPAEDVDHKDRNGLNNRWDNLRKATRSQNNGNAIRSSLNTTGFKGVSLIKPTGRYVAKISIQNKRVHLGTFDTPESAHIAYMDAAQKHFGEFARAS